MNVQDIAQEYKNLFISRGYNVGRVSVYVNVDGKCEGLHMMTIRSEQVCDLLHIRRDLAASKHFFDMKIIKEIDYDKIDWVNNSDDDLPKIDVLTVFMKGE